MHIYRRTDLHQPSALFAFGIYLVPVTVFEGDLIVVILLYIEGSEMSTKTFKKNLGQSLDKMRIKRYNTQLCLQKQARRYTIRQVGKN